MATFERVDFRDRGEAGCEPTFANLMNFSGCNKLATEMSSSIASQWIPIPPPMNSQSFFCFSVALRSRGNHTKGTDTDRPSSNMTVSSSLEQAASTARASLLVTKVGIPFLHKQISVLFDQLPNDSQLVAAKTAVRCQFDWIKPKFRITTSMCHVYVRRLSILQAIEEEPVTTNPEQHRHPPSLHPVKLRNSKDEARVVPDGT